MKQNSFDAIIFDLGGVIINLDYQLTIEAFKKLGIVNFEEMYTQAKQNNLFDDFETGKISSQHFINSLLPFLPSGTSANKVVHAWNAMILDFPKKRLELLDQLNSKYRVFLLSNTNDIHLQAVNRSLANTTDRKLDTYFEKVYLSHEVKLRKPHKEIFELVCTEQNLNPETTIFIDDTIGHVNGANSIGLKGIHLVDKTIEEMFAFN
jgi:putative hydrolase of the HAD superfamily